MMSNAQQVTSPPVSRPNLRRSRRQSPKSGTKVRVYRSPLGLGPNIAVCILDVSETGVRLVVKQDLPVRSEFHIELETLGIRPIKTIAQVVWSRTLADGNTCVGADLVRKIAYSELAALARS